MYYLVSFIVSAGLISFLSTSGYIPGIEVSHGYASLFVFAVILSLVNLILGTILRIITFPIRLLTLGAFSFVISLIVVKVADELVPGVTLIGITPLVAVALISGGVSILFRIFR